MRFMMFMYPEISDEEYLSAAQLDAGPIPEEIEAMGRYNDELRKAGMLLSLDGLTPPGEGARVKFDGDGKAAVTDGPFAEAKELVGGYWLIQARSKQEALEWASRVPGRNCTVEVRQVAEFEEFPDEVQEAYEKGDPSA
jgi:hypothetical protein